MEGKKDLMLKFGERLKEAREANNMTIKQLADTVHLTEATLSRYENGIMGAKRTTIMVLAEKLGVNPAWLIGYDAPKYLEKPEIESFKKIPILGTIAAGQPILVQENIQGYEYVLENESVDFCLRVKGDSMINTRIYDGDIVFIRQQPDVENGEIAAVIIDGEEATLKRVYKINGSVILRPENPKYQDMIFTKRDFRQVKIIGKVKAVKFYLEV